MSFHPSSHYLCHADSGGERGGGGMTEWEREREGEEFARAARLYKPAVKRHDVTLH